MHKWARKGLISYPETDAERERRGDAPPGLVKGEAPGSAARSAVRDWAGRVFLLKDVYVDWRGRVFNATHRFFAGGCSSSSSSSSSSSWQAGDGDGEEGDEDMDEEVSWPHELRLAFVFSL